MAHSRVTISEVDAKGGFWMHYYRRAFLWFGPHRLVKRVYVARSRAHG